MRTIKITGTGETFQADMDDSLLSAALRSEHSIPYECNSGGCGVCKFELISGEIEELWPSAPGLNVRDKRKGKHLACQCRAKTDLEIKLSNRGDFRSLHPPQKFSAKLISREKISAEMFRLRLTTNQPISFIPGQYYMVGQQEIGSRAYSVANSASNQYLSFIIKAIPGGKVSNTLATCPLGPLVLDGPYGLSGLQTKDEQQSIFIAGGSGIAPMVSMVNTLIEQNYTKPITVIYGSRLEAELNACNHLFISAPNLELITVLSEGGDNNNWQGENGYIHEVIPKVISCFEQSEFYLCGPPPMITAVQKLLMLEKGVPFECIHFDRFF